MKKFILMLLLFLSLTSCNTARSKNKTKLSSGDSKASTTAAKYYISSNYHFMMYNPDFMGKAMNYAWQKYSGVTVPARIYPANSCFKKGRYSSSSLSFTNISTKKITQAEIFFFSTGNPDYTSLLVKLDLIPGDSSEVNLTDSFLGENEYRLDKIDFYFQDETMLSFSADDFFHLQYSELADFDLSGSGTFFLKGNDGYYYLLIKNRKSDDENAGFFRLSITKETGEDTIVENEISYNSEYNAYSYNLWGEENMAIEDFCFAKKVNVEFRPTNGKIISEEITNSEQLEKISMWVAAFCYFGLR
ncbi:MAG: hypothetical protein UIB61_04470 [Treponema sp.]|nr:hypothetical protein [Treponema sp.]